MNHNTPFSIQIEPTMGCNKNCSFCAIYSLKDKIKKPLFMTVDLAKKIAIDLNTWLPPRRIEFALRGEPLLNPNIIDIIKTFREHYPLCQLMLTTNGIVILKRQEKIVNELFDAGLNLLNIDCYNHTYDKLESICKKSKLQVIDYYNNPTKIKLYGYNNHKIQATFLMKDLEVYNGKKLGRSILNMAGNVDPKIVEPLEEPLNKKCAKVYREMPIYYNGVVPICCMDWRQELVMGKFPEQSLKNMWMSDEWETVRELTYNKKRITRPCYMCDFGGGFRLGFLDEVKKGLTEAQQIDLLKKHYDKVKEHEFTNARTPLIYTKNSLI